MAGVASLSGGPSAAEERIDQLKASLPDEDGSSDEAEGGAKGKGERSRKWRHKEAP